MTNGTTPDIMPILNNAGRPTPPGPLTTSRIFAGRVLTSLKRAPEQMADAILIPVVFTVMFTYLFGGAMAESTAEYLEFLLPGTLVMAVLLVTVYSGLGLNTDTQLGVHDRFRTYPIWSLAPIIGRLLGDMGRYVLASLLVVGLGLIMGFRPAGGVVGVALAIGLIIIFAFSLSWIWVTLGLKLSSPQSVSVLSFVVQFPLTLASNVFVDPATMPDWLQTFVEINPVSHVTTAVRNLLYGTADLGEIIYVFVASAVLIAVFAPLSLRLYRRAEHS